MSEFFEPNSNQPSQKERARIKVGGLWMNTTENKGIKYLSGNWGPGMQIQIWPNTKRAGEAGEKDPDFTMYLTENTPKKKTEGSNNDDFTKFPAKTGKPYVAPLQSENIPF